MKTHLRQTVDAISIRFGFLARGTANRTLLMCGSLNPQHTTISSHLTDITS